MCVIANGNVELTHKYVTAVEKNLAPVLLDTVVLNAAIAGTQISVIIRVHNNNPNYLFLFLPLIPLFISWCDANIHTNQN